MIYRILVYPLLVDTEELVVVFLEAELGGVYRSRLAGGLDGLNSGA